MKNGHINIYSKFKSIKIINQNTNIYELNLCIQYNPNILPNNMLHHTLSILEMKHSFKSIKPYFFSKYCTTSQQETAENGKARLSHFDLGNR